MKLLVVIPLILAMVGLRFLRPNLLLWALAWWVALFVAFRFGFSTPIPASVIAIYMGIATLALVAYVTSSGERMRAAFEPLLRLVVERRYRPVLAGLIVLVPALLGLNAYLKTKVPIQPPFFARTIHPAPPASIEVHGNTIDLVRGHNPLRALEQSNPEQFKVHLANGRATYYKNCVYCHGDNLRATGMFAKPSPIEAASARPRKPSHTSVEDGTPAPSAAALARNTAGVQLPQQPMPETTASAPSSRSRCGSAATTARSSLPWVFPKSRQPRNRIPGKRALSPSSRNSNTSSPRKT